MPIFGVNGRSAGPGHWPRARLLSASLALAFVSLLLLLPEAARADGGGVEVYDHSHAPLGNSTITTIQGTRGVFGECRFPFPKLTRDRSGPPLEMRQVSTNLNDCTTVVETGIPFLIPYAEGESQPATTFPGRRGGTASAGQDPSTRRLQSRSATGSASFRVEWEDFLHIDTTWLRANITYSTSGTCVTSASGSSTDYYRIETGWNRQWRDTWINPSQCSYRKVWADAQYRNIPFCSPTVVYTDYRGVTVQATYAAESGWVDSTWTTEEPFSDPACPNLHWHQSLS